MSKTTLVFDLEVYRNYFLAMFRRVDTGKTRVYEMYEGQPLQVEELRRILTTYRLVSFNGNNYDIPMLTLALTGASCAKLKEASDQIILGNLRGWQFEQLHGIKIDPRIDHIDLIEVAPGQASLKLYGGRLHSQRLQDLPIEPDATIIPEQRQQLVSYCGNDLQTTIDLWNHLQPQIELRENMSKGYGIDLRSKSDAQIAEAVIRKQVSQILGQPVNKPTIPPGTTFKYEPPKWMRFTTPPLQKVFEDVIASTFTVTADGGVSMPPALNDRAVAIGSSVYRMGIGGLHSSEQCQGIVVDADHLLIDRDVTSYYPSIILGGELSPLHMRERNAFQRVYRGVVEKRVAAKKAGNKVVDSALKITINGTYGKLGSKYSAIYSPHLMIQVTVTGQLALLMLIERLESHGIRVVSGNTDGIVIHCHRAREAELLSHIQWWEQITGFNTEDTNYRAMFARDVNSYVALKKGGGIKGKGAFADASISKNPQNTICVKAVKALIEHGTPIEQTIRSSRDIREFVTVRTVRGGGCQIVQTRYDDALTPGQKRDVLLAAGALQVVPGPLTKAKFDWVPEGCGYDIETAYRIHCGEDRIKYLGKVVRFYIGKSSEGAIYYKEKNKTGGRNKVPGSDGAVPVMDLPSEFPSDVDYDFYIREANDMLAQIGASEEKLKQLHYGESADLF